MAQGVVVAGIHQRRPAGLLDQVDGRHIGPRVTRIHGVDAIPEVRQTLHMPIPLKKH
jgi:hypothetical protein